MNVTRPSRRRFLALGAAFSLATAQNFAASLTHRIFAESTERSPLPEPSWSKLPRWRGFNLLEKFGGANAPFREDDFRNISDLGFNFVRLPMNYLHWTVGNDRRRFNEKTLDEINQAIEFGQKYGVHVCVNFHRAPGYTVADPKESPLVWDDDATLDLCAFHWREFAKRWRGVPNANLSFNLFNEPAGVTEETYFRVVKRLAQEIRAEDPDRLIICDGLDWGGKPCASFKELKVAQATRGYAPMEISHYGANWVNSANFPEPSWPTSSFNGLFPSIGQREMSEAARRPLLLKGKFPKGASIVLTVNVVSRESELVATADGRETFRKRFVSSSGKGEWKKEVYSQEYKIYQNVFDLECRFELDRDANEIEISNVEGDWATISKIAIVFPDGREATAQGVANWSADERAPLTLEERGDRIEIRGGDTKDRMFLERTAVAPWRALAESGVGVMVGEFGAYNKTPIKVARAWMEDMLANWFDAGFGWALWNFRGPFGVADSGRADVDYESWRGLQLDRATVELLQRY